MTGDYHAPVMNRGPFAVFMAALDPADKACFYAFPTRVAADRFAVAHRARHPQRAIVVREMAA